MEILIMLGIRMGIISAEAFTQNLKAVLWGAHFGIRA